jgi:hypothetical protein
MRLGFGEDAGEAPENLEEGGDGGVIEGHVMLFRGSGFWQPNGVCHRWDEAWNNTTPSVAKDCLLFHNLFGPTSASSP